MRQSQIHVSALSCVSSTDKADVSNVHSRQTRCTFGSLMVEAVLMPLLHALAVVQLLLALQAVQEAQKKEMALAQVPELVRAISCATDR
jgi:hypothetical protein